MKKSDSIEGLSASDLIDQRITELIDNILDLTKLEAGRREFVKASVNLRSLALVPAGVNSGSLGIMGVIMGGVATATQVLGLLGFFESWPR